MTSHVAGPKILEFGSDQQMKEYPKDKLSVAEDREPFHAGSKPHMHDDLDSTKCTCLSSINRAGPPGCIECLSLPFLVQLGLCK